MIISKVTCDQCGDEILEDNYTFSYHSKELNYTYVKTIPNSLDVKDGETMYTTFKGNICVSCLCKLITASNKD